MLLDVYAKVPEFKYRSTGPSMKNNIIYPLKGPIPAFDPALCVRCQHTSLSRFKEPYEIEVMKDGTVHTSTVNEYKKHRMGVTCKVRREVRLQRELGLFPVPNEKVYSTFLDSTFSVKDHPSYTWKKLKYHTYAEETIVAFIRWAVLEVKHGITMQDVINFALLTEEERKNHILGMQLQWDLEHTKSHNS